MRGFYFLTVSIKNGRKYSKDSKHTWCQSWIFVYLFTGVKNISWGCVEAPCKKECTEMIAKNVADLVYLNATEMFTAGREYNLAPIIGQNKKK